MNFIRHNRGRRNAATLIVQFVAVFLCITMARFASGAPADITTNAAPLIGADPPKGVTIASGDAKVSPKTGALEYAYPIAIPPGRGGAKPSLALQYSSQAALYGGVAAGWTLTGIPEIRRDYSLGFHYQFPNPDADPLDPLHEPNAPKQRWVSSMAGGRELVLVTEDQPSNVLASFRAQSDTSFTRYQKMRDNAGTTYSWVALTTDGARYEFGFAGPSGGDFPDWAPLTRYIDAFGNQVTYRWAAVSVGGGQAPSDYNLVEILYSANPGAGLAPHARVTFEYAGNGSLCNLQPVGAQLTTNLGVERWRGASKLAKIITWVRDTPQPTAWRAVRHYALHYDQHAESCTAPHTPIRLLTSIELHNSAGTALRPAVEFRYGSMTRTKSANLSIGYHAGVNPQQTLGWGTRVTHNMIISSTMAGQLDDLDGDGRPDRVYDDSGGTGAANCRIRWDQNQVGATDDVYFADSNKTTDVPPIPWADASLPNYGLMSSDESCSLTGQHSMYVNITPDPACHEINIGHYNYYRFLDIDADGITDLVTALHYDAGHYLPPPPTDPPPGLQPACPMIDPDCFQGSNAAITCKPNGLTVSCSYDFARLNACIDAAPRQPCFDSAVSNNTIHMINDGKGPRPEGLLEYKPSFPIPPNNPCSPVRKPQMVDGKYPWTWYRGKGDGTFDIANWKRIYAPVPLVSHVGDPAPQSNHFSVSSPTHVMMDLDGDGFIDIATLNRRADDPAVEQHNDAIWWLWRGDGQGGFHGRTADVGWTWTVPTGARPRSQTSTENGKVTSDQQSGLLDVNGDGRPDYLTSFGGVVVVHYNIGHGFSQTGHPLSPKYAVIARSHSDAGTVANPLQAGGHWGIQRPVDFDGDGRPDWNVNENGTSKMYWNWLGALSPGQSISASSGLQEIAKITVLNDQSWWHIHKTARDINGDGIIDALTDHAATAATEPQNGERRAVLKQIVNGRGMTVDISYEPHTKGDSVDATGDVLPSPTWVVASLTRTDMHSPTSSPEKWTYTYIEPVWNADPVTGRRGFRGFKTIETQRPSSALTRERYDYIQDWSGRGIATTTFADAADTDHPHSISTTTWDDLTLFGGKIKTFHAVATESRSCSSGQTTSQCRSGGALLRTETTWKGIKPSGGGAVMLYATETTTRSDQAASPATGDRKTTSAYTLHYDADNYRLRSTRETLEQYSGTVWTMAGKTDHIYDAQGLVETGTDAWIDATTVAHTERAFDMQTGNLLERAKPQQVYDHGSTAPKEVYTYDTRYKLFVATTTNELGHVVETDYKLDTGALVSMRGPNSKSNKKEEVWFTLDALGRPIEKWVTVDNAQPSGPYVDKLVEKTAYFDFQSPQMLRTEQRVDYDGAVWVTTDKRSDGHGRLLRERTVVGGGLPDAVNEYVYNVSGKVVTFRTPDPTNNAAKVEYTYTYDSLGRPTSIRNPNGDGANVAWNGLEQTIKECEGDGSSCVEGGPTAAQKKLLKDVFGRLVRVSERHDNGSWQGTTYAYDASDNLAAIWNPDNVHTQLDHNWTGKRLSVERFNRIWRYGYDLNGNMVSQIMPYPSGADPADYTNTTAYDDLDRVTSRLTAPAGLNAQQVADLGVGLIINRYDEGFNGIGRLTHVAHPNKTLTLTYQHDGRGRKISERVDFNFATIGQGQLADTREIQYRYNAIGQLAQTWHADLPGGSAPTHTHVSFDARGLPVAVDGTFDGSTTTLASYTRNVAGGIVTRTSPGSVRTFTYDKLGRVTEDAAAGDTSVQFTHAISYGKTREMQEFTSKVAGTTTRSFTFTHDRRHQLKTATDPVGYSAAFAYSAGGKVMTANVAVPTSARAALNRNVVYNYVLSPDREAPDALWDAMAGVTRARYHYDQRGNVTRRYVRAEGTLDLVYDGNNDQRVADDLAGGSETYIYASPGQRIIAMRRDTTGAIDRVRLWLGETEVWYNASGVANKTWAHVNLGSPIARIENRTTVEYSHHSMLGHLIVALDEDGTVTAGFQYGPFGEVLEKTGDAANHLRQFNGKEADALSQVSYYGYRYYDPLSLSWTQSDPLYRFVPDMAGAEPRKMNVYAFSLNNPLRYVDPDGRNPVVVRRVVATGIGVCLYFDCHKKVYAAVKKYGVPVYRKVATPVGNKAREIVGGSISSFCRMFSCGLVEFPLNPEQRRLLEPKNDDNTTTEQTSGGRRKKRPSNEHRAGHERRSSRQKKDGTTRPLSTPLETFPDSSIIEMPGEISGRGLPSDKKKELAGEMMRLMQLFNKLR